MGPYRKDQPAEPPGELVAAYIKYLRGNKAPDVDRRADVLENFEAYMRQRDWLTEIWRANALCIQGYITGLSVRGFLADELHDHWLILRDFFEYLIEFEEWQRPNPVLGTLDPGADPKDPRNWPFLK